MEMDQVGQQQDQKNVKVLYNQKGFQSIIINVNMFVLTQNITIKT